MSVRPLHPTGAPGVGSPPVSVLAVARVAARAGPGEEAVAAVVRRWPHLSQEQARAALAHAGDAANELAPAPDLLVALTLAVPLGAGTLVSVGGAGCLLSIPFLTRSGPLFAGVTPSLLALLASAFLIGGAGLALRQVWGAVVVAGATLFCIGSWGPPFGGRLVYGLFASGVTAALLPYALRARWWFCAEGRAAAGAVAVGPYALAVGFGAALVVEARLLVRLAWRLYADSGMALPFVTDVTLVAAATASGCWFLAALLVIIAPAPLLWIARPGRARPLAIAVAIAGAWTVAAALGLVLMPAWRAGIL